MTRTRVQVGRDVEVIGEQADRLELQGTIRLQPSCIIEIAPSRRWLHLAGCRLLVRTWGVWRLGSGRPVYRGECRRVSKPGNQLPAGRHWQGTTVGHRAQRRWQRC